MSDILPLPLSKEKLTDFDFQFTPNPRKIINKTNLNLIILVIVILLIIAHFNWNIIRSYIYSLKDSYISFWGSVLGGTISGILTVIGVMLAFKFQERRTFLNRHIKIKNLYANYISYVGHTFFLVEQLQKYVKDVQNKNFIEEKTKHDIKRYFENLQTMEIINDFKVNKFILSSTNNSLAFFVESYFNILEKDWENMKKSFLNSSSQKNELDKLILILSKNYTEYIGLGRVIATTVHAINHAVEI